MKLETEIKIKQTIGRCEFGGDKIVFLLKGEVVGECPLVKYSMMETRHLLADDIGVKEYDDFWIVRIDGSNTVKGSETKGTGLVSETHYDTDFGTYEGKMYQVFKNKYCCKECGRNSYRLNFPEKN